ncbi:MAG: flagellar motor protein [Bacillota bacterium]
MDIALIGGILLGAIALVGGFMMEGGEVGALIVVTAGVIVFGGTAGAVIASFPMSELKKVPAIVKVALLGKDAEPIGIIDLIVQLATRARREGLLAIEPEIDRVEHPYLRKGLQMIVDGTDPSVVKNSMELSIYNTEQRHKMGANVFESAGGYAPTMGIIGTVMGLVLVLSNLEEPETLGHSIAVAFIATLYGVASANVVWLPIASKLKNKSKNETMIMEMMMEGVLAIQEGQNPKLIQARLTNFLRSQQEAGYKGVNANE